MSATIDSTARSVLCPGCGYDLRAATEGRCSECGLIIDLASLQRSAIPWAYRRELGRFRAFFKTVWLMTLDSKLLRHEAAKPQSVHGAVVFRRGVTLIVFVAVAVLGVILIQGRVIERSVVRQQSSYQPRARMPAYLQDYAVSWSAGIALRPAWLLYAALVAAWLTAAPGTVFRTRGMPPEQAEPVRAMGAYVAAPLVWLVPAIAAWGGLALQDAAEGPRPDVKYLAALMMLGYSFGLVAIGGTVHRTGQWRARTTHGGYPTGFLAMGELLLRWCLGLGVLLGAVPWCVGFVWIVIDSFVQ